METQKIVSKRFPKKKKKWKTQKITFDKNGNSKDCISIK